MGNCDSATFLACWIHRCRWMPGNFTIYSLIWGNLSQWRRELSVKIDNAGKSTYMVRYVVRTSPHHCYICISHLNDAFWPCQLQVNAYIESIKADIIEASECLNPHQCFPCQRENELILGMLLSGNEPFLKMDCGYSPQDAIEDAQQLRSPTYDEIITLLYNNNIYSHICRFHALDSQCCWPTVE